MGFLIKYTHTQADEKETNLLDGGEFSPEKRKKKKGTLQGVSSTKVLRVKIEGDLGEPFWTSSGREDGFLWRGFSR